MATEQKSKATGQQQGFVYLPLLAGWLIPGSGHFLVGKWGRGSLVSVSIVSMFVLGLGMQGKLYTEVHDILDLLGFIANLGNGLLYWMARGAGLGAQMVDHTVGDYGKIFISVAGLLNVISAVDAHNLRTGRKPL